MRLLPSWKLLCSTIYYKIQCRFFIIQEWFFVSRRKWCSRYRYMHDYVCSCVIFIVSNLLTLHKLVNFPWIQIQCKCKILLLTSWITHVLYLYIKPVNFLRTINFHCTFKVSLIVNSKASLQKFQQELLWTLEYMHPSYITKV